VWLSVWSEVQIVCIGVQLMPLPSQSPIISASLNPGWFYFPVPAYRHCPGKEAVKFAVVVVVSTSSCCLRGGECSVITNCVFVCELSPLLAADLTAVVCHAADPVIFSQAQEAERS